MNKLLITPKTKIHDLLETYPRLEDELIAAAPPFRKLKNPVLKRTITRITTVAQAATIGGLQVEELVNRLRTAAGQDILDAFSGEETDYNTDKPSWYSEEKIAKTIDIREMLHAGEQPVHEVLSAMKKLSEGEILEVIAPFIPAPLLDKASSLEYVHWLHNVSEEEFLVYFCSKATST